MTKPGLSPWTASLSMRRGMAGEKVRPGMSRPESGVGRLYSMASPRQMMRYPGSTEPEADAKRRPSVRKLVMVSKPLAPQNLPDHGHTVSGRTLGWPRVDPMTGAADDVDDTQPSAKLRPMTPFWHPTSAARACLLAVLAMCILGSAPSLAQEKDPYIRRAEDLMAEAEYEKAAKVLRLGLAREEVDTDAMVDHFALQAVCFISLGEDARATSAYTKILTMRPRFSLSSRTSPKVRNVFDATKERMKKAGLLRTTFKPLHTPIPTKRPGAPTVAKLGFEEGADSVAKVQFFFRRVGSADFTSLDARPEGSDFAVEVPSYALADSPEVYAIEYYLEAYDTDGIPVGSVGNRELPLSFLVVPTAEIETGEELGGDDSALFLAPLIVGGVVVAVAAVAAVGLGTGLYLFRPRRGSATVTVRQE